MGSEEWGVAQGILEGRAEIFEGFDCFDGFDFSAPESAARERVTRAHPPRTALRRPDLGNVVFWNSTPEASCEGKHYQLQTLIIPPFMTAQKILIIDDSKLMRYQVKEMLPPQAQIFEAADGEEGLDKIHQLLPHLVILDCFMPKLNGWQVVNQIVTYPELSHIPVVLMTGRKDEIEDNAPNLFDYFVYDYFELISKPFNQALLFQAIRKAVQKARRRNEEADARERAALSHFRQSLAPVSHRSAVQGTAITLAPISAPSILADSTPAIATPAIATPADSATRTTLDALSQLQTLQQEVQTLRRQNQELAQEMAQIKQELLQITEQI